MIKCTYTSVWGESDDVVTDCMFDVATGAILPEISYADPKGGLIREYITLPNGNVFDVCPECRDFVMKTFMGDRADLSYGEITVCRDKDCINAQ